MHSKSSVFFLSQNECACARQGIESIAAALGEQFAFSSWVTTQPTAVPLSRAGPDLVLMHVSSVAEADSFLRALRDRGSRSPIVGVFCTDEIRHDAITELLDAGIDDYICCPFKLVDLAPRIYKLLLDKKLTEKSVSPVDPIQDANGNVLVGTSEGLTKQVRLIHRFGGSDANFLITGETGTGKEVLSR